MILGIRMTDPVGALISGDPVNVLPNTTLRGAAGVLHEELVGALVVEDANGVRGIVSERDIVRALAEGADPDDTRVLDVMAEDVLAVDAGTGVADAARAMADNEVRHLVVMRGDTLVGVVSMRDVLAVVLTEREQDLPTGSPMPAASAPAAPVAGLHHAAG